MIGWETDLSMLSADYHWRLAGAVLGRKREVCAIRIHPYDRLLLGFVG